MIIVDSSVWVDYFNGIPGRHTDKLDELLGSKPVAIGDLILTEVLQGFRSDSDYKTAKKLMNSLAIVEMLGVKNAVKAADNYRALRKRGLTIRKTADVIIATYCIEQKCSLLFTDKDFLPFVKHFGMRSVLANT